MDRTSILIVDDEMIVRESLYHWFKKSGHHVDTASSGPEALVKLEKDPFDILFLDMKMPKMNGMEVLQKVAALYPETAVVIITAYGTIDTAVNAMKQGAIDYLLKPFAPESLSLVLEKVVAQKKIKAECHLLRGQLQKLTHFDNIIGQSQAMQNVFDMISDVAQSDATVLITGETGTGKELVAKAIHAKSQRNRFPFIAINCGALSETLMESELFGYQKGAFTGATHPGKGFLEVVSGGTLFLDEIGEISTRMQIDLLRVLEEKQIYRVGERIPVPVDFRLISATRKDLSRLITEEKFREDFFYRINVIKVHIPPLRERKEDISLLVTHFMEKISHDTNKHVNHIDRNTLDLLMNYSWPGNVRELENAVERAVVLAKSRTLTAEDFSFLAVNANTMTDPKSLREMEKEYVEQILIGQGWNITKAAKVLDIDRVTLHRMVKRYNLKKKSQAFNGS